MLITQINKVRTHYEVQTEDDSVYEIDGEQLRQHRFAAGTDADEQLLAELHHASRFRRACRRAYYLLDSRDYSRRMLYEKLMHTYHDAPLCRSVLDKLVQCGAVDDERYAEHLAEYLVERKRYGIFRARQEMLRRGLDKELVSDMLSEYEETAEENIPEVLERKYSRYLTDPEDRRSVDKVIAGMARLGYDYRSVRAAIHAYFEEMKDEEEDSE